MSAPAAGAWHGGAAGLKRIDALGAVLVAAGTLALLLLPFVIFKTNRIVPGDPRDLWEVLPAWGALGCELTLALAAAGALLIADARVRLVLALAGLVAVALAAAAAGNALTPPGDNIVRVAPGAAFWVLSICLGLLATDAATRLRPGPGLRVLFLAVALGVIGLSLAHGTFDHLSVGARLPPRAGQLRQSARDGTEKSRCAGN